MSLWLAELQESDKEAWKIKAKDLNGYKKIDGVLHYQGLPFVSEIIWIKLISWHHSNLLIRHFGINKTKDFVGQKYYWPGLQVDIEVYVKGCNIYLGSKTVRQKLYGVL